MLLVMVMIVLMLMIIPIFWLAFTRPGKNLLIKIFENKKYVICHVKRASTDFEDIWNIIPNPDYFTTVGKFDYNLNPQYAMMKWKGRLHFHIDEGDAIPKYINRKDTPQEILMQVQEIKTALHNKAYNFLYGKSPNIALIIACVACGIALLIAIYGIYEIQKIAPMITWLYEHPPQAIVAPIVGT
jgi:hypothetical protein